jgi:hypothetical protein
LAAATAATTLHTWDSAAHPAAESIVPLQSLGLQGQ